MIYLRLFWSFFQVGLFSFGGGYGALPLISDRIVGQRGWLTIGEFGDIVTISQMTPGPIGINAASFVGTRVAGFAGSLAATAGFVAPACVIVLLLAYMYKKYSKSNALQGVLAGLRPATVGLIAAAALSIASLSLFGSEVRDIRLSAFDIVALLTAAASYAILKLTKISPVLVILCAGAVGGLAYGLL